MKCVVTGIMLVLLAFAPSFAQRPEIGLTAGPTLSKMWGSRIMDSYESRVGFAAGLYFRQPLGKGFSVAVNPAFERKGSKFEFIMTDNTGGVLDKSYTYMNFDYVVLPVMARYDLAPFYVTGGMYVGFLQRQFYNFGFDTQNVPIETDGTEFFDTHDIGWLAGLGFAHDLRRSSSTLFAELRYTRGGKDIMSHPEVTYEVRAQSSMLMLGITRKL